MSDLDLIQEGCPETKRHERADSVRQALVERNALDVRVSVQLEDYHSRLSAEDARFIVVGEFLRHHSKYPGHGPQRSYLLAKTVLGLLRTESNERYQSTALRIDTPEAWHAAAIKVGSAHDEFFDDARRLLAHPAAENEEALSLVKFLDEDISDHDLYEMWLVESGNRTAVPSWLAHLMRGQVMSAKAALSTKPRLTR